MLDRTIRNQVERAELKITAEFEEKRKELDNKFDKSINLRKEKIEGWISDHDLEDRLINACRILLVGQREHDNVVKVLQNAGFRDKNIYIKLEDEESESSPTEYEILFINNELGGINDKKTLLEFVQNKSCKQALVFYYNETRVYFPTDDLTDDLKDKVNFANSPAQIFGNILNTIKYRKRLIRFGHLK
jgi:hypothetical protein